MTMRNWCKIRKRVCCPCHENKELHGTSEAVQVYISLGVCLSRYKSPGKTVQLRMLISGHFQPPSAKGSLPRGDTNKESH